MADVFTMLETDHRQVEQLLDELSSSERGPEREQLVAKLTAALQLHMRFEEQQLYPLLQRIDAEMAQEAETEHTLTRDGIDKLTSLVAQPGFGAVVDMLKGGIGHHVEEEEEEVFPKLRENLEAAQLDQLATQLKATKAEAGTLADDLAMMSKQQLTEMAKDAGIEGRSSMSADELRTALGG